MPGLQLDVSFAASERGVTALFGPSGAGKTSVVNVIAGSLQPDAGYIRAFGTTLFDSDRGIDVSPEQRRVSQVFQEARLFPHYTVRGNLLYGRRRRAASHARVPSFDEMVDLLDLGSLLKRRPRHLSGGERQRVAVGRALLANPRLLLMDEPLASLDPHRKAAILPFIERIRDETDTPIVYVSHAVDEVARLSDQVVQIDSGRVVTTGPPADVLPQDDDLPACRPDTGVELQARVARHHPADGLSELAVSGTSIFARLTDLPVGAEVCVRIRACDVALATQPPSLTSFVNVLPGVIGDWHDTGGPEIGVRINVSNASVWARITRRSTRSLNLALGDRVFALIKGVAVARYAVPPSSDHAD